MKHFHRATGLSTLLVVAFAVSAASALADKPPNPNQTPRAAAPAMPITSQAALRFELAGKDPASFGFAVTQPGPVTVEVTSQGAPIRVDLVGPQPQTQTGTGRLAFSAQVTPTDVQRGVLWSVHIALQNPPAVPGQPQAGGSVAIHAPPADTNVVQQQLSALANQAQTGAQQAQTALQADVNQKLQASRAQLAGQQDAIRARAAQGQVSTRGIASAPMKTMDQARFKNLQLPGPPQITRVDVPSALPRQKVVIEGSGFGNQPGAVQFALSPARSDPGVVNTWNDITITVFVPDASGLLAYPGHVNVVRAGDNARSNDWPLAFAPEMEIRQISQTVDAVIGLPGQMGQGGGYVWHGWNSLGDAFVGAKNDDVLFPTSRLSNGWLVDWGAVFPLASNSINGRSLDAYVTDSRPNTDMPFLRVHWWRDPFAELRYQFLVQIHGPRGVPDGAACVQAPCP